MDETSPVLPFDPHSAQMIADPYPTYDALRLAGAVHHSPELNLWVLARHSDVRAALHNWQVFSSTSGVELGEPLFGTGDPIVNDPPQHSVLRDLVGRHFHSRVVENLRPVVRSRCEQLLDSISDRSDIDFVGQYAGRIPGTTMCSMLSFPSDDESWITAKVNEMMNRSLEASDLFRAEAAKAALWYYVEEQISLGTRPANGRNVTPLLSQICKARTDGLILTDDAVGLCLSLLTAGTETTTALITTILWRLVRGDITMPDLIPDGDVIAGRAIDEVLRFDSPIQWLTRTTTQEVDVSGEVVPAGSRVVLLFASANRDSKAFQNPDVINVYRDQSRSLSFGGGIHFCLGRLLARVETKEALGVFVRRYQVPQLSDTPVRYPSSWLRSFSSLPIKIEAR
ncbi:MAG: cytochrome P450 [Actinomycetota bacterium]|nr:cytochrome P450 [Actinomycetota bacterium]